MVIKLGDKEVESAETSGNKVLELRGEWQWGRGVQSAAKKGDWDVRSPGGGLVRGSVGGRVGGSFIGTLQI